MANYIGLGQYTEDDTRFTLSLYEKNSSGYEWYAGMLQENGQPGALKTAKRFDATPREMREIISEMTKAGKWSRVELRWWWQ